MPKYIDQEALLKDIEESVVFSVREGQPSLEIRGANKITERIKSAPIVDVVEVKQGEWQEGRWCDNFQHICSLCHKTARVHPQSVAYKYCPYCGAKMKECEK